MIEPMMNAPLTAPEEDHEHAAFWAVVPTRAAAHYATLPSEVRAILRLCDGSRRLWAICSESPLPVETTARVVGRLASLGLVVADQPRAARRATPASIKRWCAQTPAIRHRAQATLRAVSRPDVVAAVVHAFTAEEEAFFSRLASVPDHPSSK
ncbi:MAG: DUF742 domain-containing protein [Myxococcales bacterium]|nr:DUF742 domain-containing protein [Myxococcales bacterium]